MLRVLRVSNEEVLMKRIAAMLIVLSFVWLAGSAQGRTWHIKSDGSGDAPAIQAGIDSSAAGDTVLVSAGTYNENLTVNASQNGVRILSEAGASETIVLAAAPGTVVDFIGVNRSTVLKGFTLTGGTGAPNPEDPGSFHGGGVRAYYCSPSILENVIKDNRVEPGRGGGIQSFGGSPLIQGNVIQGNFASYHGGAIHVEHGSPDIIGNRIVGNTTLGGGAVTAYYSTILVSRNEISSNEAYINGGGIVVDHCQVVIEGNILGNNCSHSIGGGVFLAACTGTVLRNTIVNNRAGSSAGIACLGGESPDVQRNIVVWNSAQLAGGIGCDEITSPVFNCNDVWSNSPTNYGGSCADQTGIDGNISVDPKFCDPAGNSFYICQNSPCAPGHHPQGADCGLIGALGVGCGPTAVQNTTWGRIKSMFR
jgi:hypothetical protein